MADWTTPKTWAVSDVLTAADMNTYVRDNTPVFYWLTSQYENKNTATEIDMTQGQITLAANVLGANRRMESWFSGGLLNATGSAKNRPYYRFKLGGVTVFDTGTIGSIPNSGSSTFGQWQFRWTMQMLNATNAQEHTLEGWFVDGTKLNFTTGVGAMSQGDWFTGRNATTIDTTTSLVLQLTTNNGTASNSLSQILYATKVAIGV